MDGNIGEKPYEKGDEFLIEITPTVIDGMDIINKWRFR